ncbi:DNA adenine methylase [Winogradskyella immobilis]|uniref:site-specific DNA-methyltransferase (adenine-specific) n=1 Tax=Winogradskyella immobilis TaxID=2816852 RepID=A0ABS8EJE1_9FLAO|nr:DNA adenine methylase [Winogradskyella immobilis]MCC1483310.1 DNA adenine methylase [Winogradskyella immobilis]MCG0015404.1 DNA adenine methylase [Winogradskyella immobilis]
MGSKARFAKDLLSIILKDRKPNQAYIEPFAGGMNMIDKVDGIRIANDQHQELMAMWQALIYDAWDPPKTISEAEYKHIRTHQTEYPKHLLGYVGFNSFGGKWFSGYRRDKEGKRDYWGEHYRNITKQVPNLEGVQLSCQSYTDLEIPKNSIIYCDPPYASTTKYRDGFNHDEFWSWCREQSKAGHQVFISEYNAPEDFKCIWEKGAKTTFSWHAKNLSTKESVERLFVYTG